MRNLKAKSGEQLFKAVRIRIFHPGNKRSVTQFHRAQQGQGITAQGIDSILKHTADKIETSWPSEEYSMVQLSPSSFNFVWRAGEQIEASVAS